MWDLLVVCDWTEIKFLYPSQIVYCGKYSFYFVLKAQEWKTACLMSYKPTASSMGSLHQQQPCALIINSTYVVVRRALN